MKKNKTKKQKNKDDKTIKFVIVAGVVLIAIAILVVAFKDNNNYILKSEYSINEVGYIDDIEVSLINTSYINNDTGIEVTFKITNKRDNTITITPDDYFVFYDINKVQIPNKYTNDKNIIKKNETINYKLQYDVTKKELYDIYFYSQVVENNIKFSFKSSDINNDVLTEEKVNSEEEQKLE
ncbi:MAG: hypothetical protein ACI4PE_05655 [Bacilli bacterium]